MSYDLITIVESSSQQSKLCLRPVPGLSLQGASPDGPEYLHHLLQEDDQFLHVQPLLIDRDLGKVLISSQKMLQSSELVVE